MSEENCTACSDGDTCTACGNNTYLLDESCVTDCPSEGAYYNNNGICSACEENCTACSDGDTCTTCGSGYVLTGGDCLSDCVLGPDNPNNGTYGVCTNTEHGGTCPLTCNAGYFETGDGQAECEGGQWINGDTCEACESNCDGCSDNATCTDCADNYYLLDENCVSSCPAEGAYYNDTGICSDCADNCNACTDDETCTDCVAGFFIDAQIAAWNQTGADIDGEATADMSGGAVSLSADGSIVAIGAIGNDATGSYSGHVRVYQLVGSAWTQIGADIDGEAAGDQSGKSVSLSNDGTILAIGAIYNDGNGLYSGHVRMFQWDGTAWNQMGADIDGEASYDYSGSSVSLSSDGSRVAIGATGNDGGADGSGHVRIYQWSNSNWTQLGTDIDGEAMNDQSGYSVSLSNDGNRVAIGAVGSGDNGHYSGHVRVYQYDGTAWTQLGLDIDGEAAGDQSGVSVSLSSDGSRVAIGALSNDGTGNGAGHVRIYQWSGSQWTQLGTDIDGEAAGDNSGGAVSLSGDGSLVAIGANINHGGGVWTGHARLYQWSGSQWTQLGTDIDGEANDDNSGGAVSISSDGDVVAIGAAYNDGNGGASGHVRVYGFESGSATCDVCETNCTVCTDGDTCTTCGNNTYLLNESCVADCPSEGAYYNGNGICVACEANCTACTDGDTCTTCADNYYLLDESCVSSCPAEGAYYNGNGICSACETNCTACTDGDTCTTCGNNTYLLNASCVADCPSEGAYYNGNGICSACEANCTACTDGDTCTTCGSGYTLTGGDCLSDCVLGPDNPNDGSYGVCTNTEHGGTCPLTCNAGYYETSDGQAECDGGQWINGDTCEACESNCDDCSDNATCIDCADNYYLLDESCVSSCPAEGAYYNGNGVCSDCADNCNACTDDETCTECVAGFFVETSVEAWAQTGSDLDGEAPNDNSGGAVSLSSDGSIVAIGATDNDGNGGYSGHTRVFQLVGLTWTQLGADIDGEMANDKSGHSVSLSGDGTILAVGAHDNDGNGLSSGHVRLYEWDGTAWNQMGADLDGEAAGDKFGWSVSLSNDGSLVAIGGPNNDGNGSSSGHVRVYQWSGSQWTQLGADIDGEVAGDNSGWSVSLSSDGSRVAMSAITNNDNGHYSGQVRVYEYDGTAWTQLGTDLDGEAANDQSGWSISLSSDGSRVAIGALANDGNGGDSGHVRIYQYDGTAWTQLGTDLDGEAAGDQAGYSVSLSADGSLVAIGGLGNDDGGSWAGHARLYEWNGSAWTQEGNDFDGEAAKDFSGGAVSLSSDGNVLAIGAEGNDDAGNYAGHVRVYGLEGAESTCTVCEANCTVCTDGETCTTCNNNTYLLNESCVADCPSEGAYYNGNGICSACEANCTACTDGDTCTTCDNNTYLLNESCVADCPSEGAYYNGNGICVACEANCTACTDGDTCTTCANNYYLLDESCVSSCPAEGAYYNGNGICGACEANCTACTDGDTCTTCDSNTYLLDASCVADCPSEGAYYNGNGICSACEANCTACTDGDTCTTCGNNTYLLDESCVADCPSEGAYYNNNGICSACEENCTACSDGDTCTTCGSGYTLTGGNCLSDCVLGPDNPNNGTYGVCTNTEHGSNCTLTCNTGYYASDDAQAECDDGNWTNGDTCEACSSNCDTCTDGDTCTDCAAGYFTATADWTQLGADIDGEASYDASGHSVSLSNDGSRVAISAYGNDGNGNNSGHVRVYELSGSAWTQMGADIDGEAADDQGRSVSLSSDGSRVAIGAARNDGNGTSSGHVRVYEWSGSAWAQMGTDIDGEAAFDTSGDSVSLSSDGSLVAIGAKGNDGGGSNAGHVRVYKWSGSAWAQLGADIDGEAAEDQSGISVSLSSDGSRVAIGANTNDGNGPSSGHVRVYEWSDSAWTQLGADIDGESSSDQSGYSVSLSSDGSVVAIGAILNAGNGWDSGHVRVYQWSGSEWTQMGTDIDAEAAGDYSGVSVSLSSDGGVVAIGAMYNQGNGYNAGHARVYEWSGSAWTQWGADIDGEVAGDASGQSVSLSSDGSVVAIGAERNDDSANNSGHVRIHENGEGTCTACEANCDECSDADTCTTCDNNTYLLNASCVADCTAQGAYYNGTGVCVACETNCTACSDSDICTACGNNTYLLNASCVADCPAGYYNGTGVCEACDVSCTLCTDADTCTSCAVNYYLLNASCVVDCPSQGAYYNDNNNNVCSACEANCTACSDADTCTACADGYTLSGGDCANLTPTEMLLNGGFEDGVSYWTGATIAPKGTPYEGSGHIFLLTNVNPYQVLQTPVSRENLTSFTLYCDGTYQYDSTLTVRLKVSGVEETLGTCTCPGTSGGYELCDLSADLSGLSSGQVTEVKLRNNGENIYMAVDSVSLMGSL
jgi:hypothetical protein